ncbi:MAG: hypothetical protein ACRC6K_00200 [Fusobacteriaceae bacterium]
MIEVTKVELKVKIEECLKLAKSKNGELVMYSKGAEEEYVIISMKDFLTFKTNKNDIIEVTIYDKKEDDDIFYEEYRLIEAEDKALKKIELQLKNTNYFSKFIKK